MGKFGTEQESMDGSAARVVDAAGFINIKFQCGPLRMVGVNGVSIEDVMDVLIARLRGFQNGPFRCRENALALTHLEESRMWLTERTRIRQGKGVEGLNAGHDACDRPSTRAFIRPASAEERG